MIILMWSWNYCHLLIIDVKNFIITLMWNWNIVKYLIMKHATKTVQSISLQLDWTFEHGYILENWGCFESCIQRPELSEGLNFCHWFFEHRLGHSCAQKYDNLGGSNWGILLSRHVVVFGQFNDLDICDKDSLSPVIDNYMCACVNKRTSSKRSSSLFSKKAKYIPLWDIHWIPGLVSQYPIMQHTTCSSRLMLKVALSCCVMILRSPSIDVLSIIYSITNNSCFVNKWNVIAQLNTHGASTKI
jgi:hypothetical protein